MLLGDRFLFISAFLAIISVLKQLNVSTID
jgi:hypothetical protein